MNADTGLQVVQIGPLRLAYRIAGHGPPLVLLHGGMDDSRSWRRQIAGLADEYTVLAWDAPGCGRSSDVPETWRMGDWADALAAWLQAIGVERAHILGLSWGSTIALAFQDRYSRVPISLILASAYAGWAGSLPPAEVAARLQGALAAADLPQETLLQGWPGMLSSAASPELVGELTAIWADSAGSVHPGGFRASVRAMAEADLREVLPRIQVPTLLLYGALDERAPLRVAHDLLARIPSSRLVVMEGVGHLSNVEAPEAFNAHVRAFIRSVVER